jgi:hypothetical protein
MFGCWRKILFRKSTNIKQLRNVMCAATVLLLIAFARNAYGDIFTMTWDGLYGSGSAVLTATQDGTDQWTVTALNGNQEELSISLVGSADSEASFSACPIWQRCSDESIHPGPPAT